MACMGIDLYDDQIELMNDVRVALRTSKSVLMQAATGFGKSVVTSYMFESAIAKGKRVMMVVPRRQLLSQMSNNFSEFGIKHSFVAAGKEHKENQNAYVATSGSLVNRLDKAPQVDLVAIDETHHGQAAIDSIIKHYRNLGSYIIGLSATPMKTSGRGLGCWYDKMVCGKSIRWLIDNKRLSEYRLFAPYSPDLSQIKTLAGDYHHGELSEFAENNKALIGNVAEHYYKHAMGRINVTFGVSRKHAILLNQAFLGLGIPSAYVDGETPDDERKMIFKSLAKREILNVCNCELLTYGFDLSLAAEMPVTIESLSIARSTKSLPLLMQIFGRVLRYKDYPAIIFDHSGSTGRLGLPDDDRSWSLADTIKKKKDEKPEVSIRQCSLCYAVHRPAPKCPSCGFVYPIKSREIQEEDGELNEIDIRARIKKEVKAAKTEEDLIKLAEQRGYKNPSGWAYIIMRERNKWRFKK